MALAFKSNRTDDDTNNFTTSTAADDEDMWRRIRTFFNLHNSMIILGIICLAFFFVTLCLVLIILHLLKNKRSYQGPMTHNPSSSYPKLDHPVSFQTSPTQMGFTSNQMTSLGNILPSSKDIQIQESTPTMLSSSSFHQSNQTQSFDNFEHELKRTWNERGITNPRSFTSDDEVETVNEVLEMEERNGKVYYKVNFTGHPSDYTAWVCEEDLIPE
ncbi:unnamed protein product [Adineta ricciae]|uniref:Chromo domain-containing protein n=1 Tax=Adineta ricciae TaxID=249248 RepID=A0A814SQ61_ADIRI|nr:unnamed protein product [Adineta ricciae]